MNFQDLLNLCQTIINVYVAIHFIRLTLEDRKKFKRIKADLKKEIKYYEK